MQLAPKHKKNAANKALIDAEFFWALKYGIFQSTNKRVHFQSLKNCETFSNGLSRYAMPKWQIKYELNSCQEKKLQFATDTKFAAEAD